MTIVGSDASSPPFCGPEEGAECASCKQLYDFLRSAISRISDNLEQLSVRVEDIYQQQQLLNKQLRPGAPPRPGAAQAARKLSAVQPAEQQPAEQQLAAPTGNLADFFSTLMADRPPPEQGSDGHLSSSAASPASATAEIKTEQLSQ